jgi:hypothetical protein
MFGKRRAAQAVVESWAFPLLKRGKDCLEIGALAQSEWL